MRWARVIAAAVAVVLVAGVGSAVVRARSGTDHPTTTGPRAAARFVEAWEAKLRGTYVVEETVSRKAGGGQSLTQGSRLVQRPPDRLLVGLGAVDGRVGGKLIRCGSTASGDPSCGPTTDAPSYDDDVQAELTTLRSYVTGARPLYAVTDFGDDCFRLDLALQLPAPPYGQHALFCFDKATGAPLLTVIDDGTVTVRTEAAAVRADVTDADLQIPADRGSAVIVPPVTSASDAATGSS